MTVVLRASLALGLFALAAQARAQGTPVIEPGREGEIVALFAPFGLGGDVRDGYRLANIRVAGTRIVAELARPAGETAELVLLHPESGPRGAARSASFAIVRGASRPDAAAALDALEEAVVRNDPGGFWRVRAGPRADAPHPLRGQAIVAWATDGTLLFLAGLVILGLVVARQLRGSARPTAALLLAIVTAGALYRLWLAPETVLGAWPYSRTTPIERLVWEGPALASLTALTGPIAWFDFATTLTLLFAVVTPLALFGHARRLFGDDRRALLAAAAIAVLPNHVRFSHSEVAFIPSLALSATTFMLLSVAAGDASRRMRAAALIAVGPIALATFVTRPLNIVFLPLFLADLAWLERAPARRRVAPGVLVSAAGAIAVVTHLIPYYATQIHEGSDPAVLARAVRAFFTLRWNTLVHPGITPPVLLLAACLGVAWRRRAERRLVVFLLAWLGVFFVTHAYVLPEETAMQCRYHLHLAAPFVLLAAMGLAALLERRPRAGVVAIALVAISPLVHLDFVTDVAFNDQRELAFVRAAAAELDPGCTVLEHAGRNDQDARFARAGTFLEGDRVGRRFRVVPIAAPEGAPDPLREEARAALSAPGCVVYYEGLPCYGEASIAPACAAMRAAVPLDLVAERSFPSRLYDANLDPHTDRVRLSLFAVRPRRTR